MSDRHVSCRNTTVYTYSGQWNTTPYQGGEALIWLNIIIQFRFICHHHTIPELHKEIDKISRHPILSHPIPSQPRRLNLPSPGTGRLFHKLHAMERYGTVTTVQYGPYWLAGRKDLCCRNPACILETTQSSQKPTFSIPAFGFTVQNDCDQHHIRSSGKTTCNLLVGTWFRPPYLR